MLAAGVAVFGASHQFSEHTPQMSWFHRDSESCSGADCSKPPDSDHDLFFFLVQVWLGEVLWSFFSVQALNWLSLVVGLIYNPSKKWFVVVA